MSVLLHVMVIEFCGARVGKQTLQTDFCNPKERGVTPNPPELRLLMGTKCIPAHSNEMKNRNAWEPTQSFLDGRCCPTLPVRNAKKFEPVFGSLFAEPCATLVLG